VLGAGLLEPLEPRQPAETRAMIMPMTAKRRTSSETREAGAWFREFPTAMSSCRA
jgi:hypothetical protein